MDQFSKRGLGPGQVYSGDKLGPELALHIERLALNMI